MALLRTLIDDDQEDSEPALSQELRELYDGNLHFRTSPAARPFVFANFVSTLDGIASYETKGKFAGSTVNDSDPADRFIMGLLRASADAVMVGSRTAQSVSAKSLWTPEYVYPDAKRFFAEYRARMLHKPEYPFLVVVSGSGKLELGRAIFRPSPMRTVVITTPAGRDELMRLGAGAPGPFEIHALDSGGDNIAPAAILELLQSQFGVRMLLHEGGPTLFGQFLAAGAVDELFLTLSPQIAGRKGNSIRPAIVEGVEFQPDSAPWFQILSAKEGEGHFYLRYRRN